jgi:hypothetical protein
VSRRVQEEGLHREAVDLSVGGAEERPHLAPGDPRDGLAELAYRRILDGCPLVAQVLLLALINHVALRLGERVFEKKTTSASGPAQYVRALFGRPNLLCRRTISRGDVHDELHVVLDSDRLPSVDTAPPSGSSGRLALESRSNRARATQPL